MGTFFKYIFYLAILIVLGYIGYIVYDYYTQEQTVSSETIVVNE